MLLDELYVKIPSNSERVTFIPIEVEKKFENELKTHLYKQFELLNQI